MTHRDLFPWVIQDHATHNLGVYLAHMRALAAAGTRGSDSLAGLVREDSLAGLVEGDDTTTLRGMRGLLMLADGRVLRGRLRSDGVILDLTEPEFRPVRTYDEFQQLREDMGGRDGAIIYDGSSWEGAPVSKVSNNSPALNAARQQIPYLVPPNFVRKSATSLTPADIDRDFGTKTDIAIAAAVAYGIDTYLIRLSPSGELGIPKAAHFGPRGLEEEFYFDPSKNGRIMCVLDTYRNNGTRVVLVDRLTADTGVQDPMYRLREERRRMEECRQRTIEGRAAA